MLFFRINFKITFFQSFPCVILRGLASISLKIWFISQLQYYFSLTTIQTWCWHVAPIALWGKKSIYMSDNYALDTKITIKYIQTTQADTKALHLYIVVHLLHQSFQGTFNQYRGEEWLYCRHRYIWLNLMKHKENEYNLSHTTKTATAYNGIAQTPFMERERPILLSRDCKITSPLSVDCMS